MNIVHFLDHKLEENLGGVEKFTAEWTPLSRHKHTILGASDFALPKRHKLSSLIFHKKNLVAKIRDRIPKDSVIHIHQIVPWGFRNLIELASHFRTGLSIHDYFLWCQKVHFLKSLEPLRNCQEAKVLKCSYCLKGLLAPVVTPFFKSRFSLMNTLLEKLEWIHCPNSELISHLPEVFHHKVKVIPYGIAPVEVQKYPKEENRYTYLGSFGAHKGLSNLLKMLKEIRFQGHLDIFGPAPGPQIELPHFASYRGILNDHSELSRYQAMFCPSLWKETGPMIALEGLLQKTPVIAHEYALNKDFSSLEGVLCYQTAQELKQRISQTTTVRQFSTPKFHQEVASMFDEKLYSFQG